MNYYLGAIMKQLKKSIAVFILIIVILSITGCSLPGAISIAICFKMI